MYIYKIGKMTRGEREKTIIDMLEEIFKYRTAECTLKDYNNEGIYLQ